MAKKHINQLINSLKSYFSELADLDSEAVEISSKKMVDPEDWAEITDNLRKLSIHLSNINSLLAMALDTKDFTSALTSRRNLIKSLTEVLARVKVEQPDSDLIINYENMLETHKATLKLLEDTEKFRSYPNSTKNYKKWVKKGWVDITYPPFIEVDNSLSEIKNLLALEVD